jgi:hypothetical protein
LDGCLVKRCLIGGLPPAPDPSRLHSSVAARQGVADAILRRILGHAPKRGDLLHRHYVSLDARDVAGPLEQIQAALLSSDRSVAYNCHPFD